MNRSSRRINRKKAIPLCFQKSHSNSQFLAAANYKHQIKKLKKVNKELARSLQDTKCRVADQEKALAECTRENTQTMFVKMKIKDIVETVQKLVTDLGEVYDVLDGKSYDVLKSLSVYHQEARLQMRNPSISTIEESASMSTIEQDLSQEEIPSGESSAQPARIELPASTPSTFDADCSQTEIYNVPVVLASEQKLQNTLNGNQSAVARASKSLEHTGSFPLDPDSPPTPQPPVLPLNIQLCMKSQGFDVAKLKPITSQLPNTLQPATSKSTVKNTPKLTISKIPVKKLVTSTEDNSPVLTVPSNYMNRRKTFVVDEKVEETPVSGQRSAFALNSLAEDAKSDIIFDRRGTFVLSSVPEEAKSDIISDQGGMFMMSSLPDNAKSHIISDRRGTFVLNPLTNNAKSDTILDRRGTYFIPTQLEEQPDTSPPKVETHNPIQNAVPNQTICVCEDMELTEILPSQNQCLQFGPTLKEKPKTEEPGLNEKLSGQPLLNTSLVKQSTVSNINPSNQLEVNITHVAVKDAQIQNTIYVKKDDNNKSLASNILTKTKLLAETVALKQDVNPTDLRQEKNKGTDAEKKLAKNESINVNMKSSAKKPPSPIACFTKPHMSIQNKIFESFSAINTEPSKKKSKSDTTLVKDDNKVSSTSKDSLSTNQPTIEKVTLNEDAESPKTRRRSSRKQNQCFANFFSDSEESSIDFDKDFVPEKRFSLKPGRKIINPNNNKVFVFKKFSKKSSIDKDTTPESSPDKSVDEDIKNDQKKDIFNFSASSEADKSPLTKSKKRKSVMPKNSKRSVNKQSDVGKRLSKTTTKRSSKPEVNKEEVPLAVPSRKSILCLNKGNSPMPLRHSSQFSRKSVRFTVVGTSSQDEVNHSKSNLLHEDNVTASNQESDDIEKVSSRSTRGSQNKKLSTKKKYSSARSNSLTPTGDILKSSCAKLKRSRKRHSSSLNSDSPEDVRELDCSPKKRMLQIFDETPSRKVETHASLSCEKQEENKNVEGRFDSGSVPPKVPEEKPSGGKKGKNSELPNVDANVKAAGSADKVGKTDVSKVKKLFSGVSERRSNKKQSIVDDLPSEVHEKKLTDRKREKNSGAILSELPQNLDVKVTGSANDTEGTNINKVKRPFSGVSERRSNKKLSIADDLFPSLDDAICEMDDDNMEAIFKLAENEPTEIYNVKEIAKSIETDCNKDNAVATKTPKQKSTALKKKTSKKTKSSSKQSKDKENMPNNTEFKLDVLTSDGNLCPLVGFKDCMEKAVKSKNSRKKKESIPLLQNDMKADVLTPGNTIESDEPVSGRSRRHRKVTCFKEPSLNRKMRRE